MNMTQEQIKNAILWDLKNNVIATFQIRERLKMKGITSFEVERLENEILEAYKNDQTRC